MADVDQVEAFSLAFKTLVLKIAGKAPQDDSTIWRTKKRIFTALDIDPVSSMKSVGKYLYKYFKQIYDCNASFFIYNTFSEELNSSSNVELAMHLINAIKIVWRDMSSEEQETFWQKIHTMLDCYIEYEASLKGIK